MKGRLLAVFCLLKVDTDFYRLFLEEFLEEDFSEELGWIPVDCLREIVVQRMPCFVVSNNTLVEMLGYFRRTVIISARASVDMVHFYLGYVRGVT